MWIICLHEFSVYLFDSIESTMYSETLSLI